jgi:hypothetical protein
MFDGSDMEVTNRVSKFRIVDKVEMNRRAPANRGERSVKAPGVSTNLVKRVSAARFDRRDSCKLGRQIVRRKCLDVHFD